MTARSTRLAMVFVGAAAALWLGVSAANADTSDSVTFSHREHAARVTSSKCTDCHDAGPKAGPVAKVRADTCRKCHDVIPSFTPASRGRQLAVRFPHGPHQAGRTCTTCHAQSKEDAAGPQWGTLPVATDCIACHRRSTGAPAETNCKSCHERNERRFKPETHRLSWIRTHGKSAFDGFDGGVHGQTCKTCHREAGCRTCHQVQSPRDHTALWRVRTHGTAASWDRARCKTCHQTGQCISCHQTAEPMNHRGSWNSTHGLVARSRGDSSCLTCHKQNFCIECHRGRR